MHNVSLTQSRASRGLLYKSNGKNAKITSLLRKYVPLRSSQAVAGLFAVAAVDKSVVAAAPDAVVAD